MKPAILVLSVFLSAALGACDGDGVGVTLGPPYACGHGGLQCEGDEACAGTGKGVCSGPEPGPSGCGPDCQAFRCGGQTVCLCSSFACVDVGACTTCACVLARPGHEACDCEAVDGHLLLECPGA